MSYLGGGPGKIYLPPPGGSLDYSQLNPATTTALVSQLRNRVINGACELAQWPSVATANGMNQYSGPDRFRTVNSAGGSFTQSRGSLVYNGITRFAVKQIVNSVIVDTSGTNNWSGINQPIEGFLVYDLLGKPVGLSFLWFSNVAGVVNAAVRDASGTYSYVTRFTSIANTVQKIEILVPAIPLAASIPTSTTQGMSLNVGFINGSTYRTGQTEQWLAGNFLCSADAVNWGATVNNFISLSDLQLENGSIITPFERRFYPLEFTMCQRYCQILPATGTLVGGWNSAGLAIYTDFNFPVTMRATPIVTPINGYLYNNATAYQATSISPSSFRGATNITATGYGWGYATNGLVLNAEL